MKRDWLTRLLLGAIAVALWILVLKPLLTPIPATAAAPPSGDYAIAVNNDTIYVIANGKIMKWRERNVLKKEAEHDLNEKVK